MDNIDIARKFQLLGKLMELHGENPFKTRSYANAYLNLRKWPDALTEMPTEELARIPGVGKAINEKIIEIRETGKLQALDKLLEITPEGVIQMLSIKGFGPGKVRTVWKDLGVETIGELLYAVNENRLLDLKGFGAKTQASLKKQLEYYLDSKGKMHYAQAAALALQIKENIQRALPEVKLEFTSGLHRKDIIIDMLAFITTAKENDIVAIIKGLEGFEEREEGMHFHGIRLEFIYSLAEDFIYEWVKTSCGDAFWNKLQIKKASYESTEELFSKNKQPYFIPEFREDFNVGRMDSYPGESSVIEYVDIRGCIHNHSTYSDGLNTIEEMIDASAGHSHEYFVITDHSRSAFYAEGLSIERLYTQLEEIRLLDQSRNDIRLFSGIESDILNNGELDYPDDVLGQLDLVIASVHSNLKMDRSKATKRLITAIENPYTSILGHPTGRLLLSRQGYPVDMEKIIDACAANNVAIEINSNPYRLDIDWKWIHYCLEKEVLLSINPDAHSIVGIQDIYFGVCAARKAALPKSHCLNTFSLEEFEEWLGEQHGKR